MVVEMTETGAAEHLDRLASKYARRPVRFFGDAIPASFAQTETPVLCRIRPTHVVGLDATGPDRRDGDEKRHRTDPFVPEPLPVPASHLDLLTRPVCGVLSTLGHDGQPQSTVVWVDLDRECALPGRRDDTASRPRPRGKARQEPLSRGQWSPRAITPAAV